MLKYHVFRAMIFSFTEKKIMQKSLKLIYKYRKWSWNNTDFNITYYMFSFSAEENLLYVTNMLPLFEIKHCPLFLKA